MKYKLICLTILAILPIHSQEEKLQKTNSKDLARYSKAYFASGCFWCTEAIFESLKGVKEVFSGYSGGKVANPTYKKISSGTTKYAETVKVFYDTTIISFPTLVNVFFGSHDPTTLNRQGPDRGPQYRSIAFFTNSAEQKIIQQKINLLNKENTFSKPIITEVVPFQKFYKAEKYHQDYEKKHPENPYIRSVSIPRINKFKKKFIQLLKESKKH